MNRHHHVDRGADRLDEHQRVCILRLWCAKEAAGKALGRGLAAGLHSLEVIEAGAHDGRVRLRLAKGLDAEFPAVGRAGITAFTTREGDFVTSAIASA